MQTYTTQMDAARKGIITPQMEIVAKKEYRTPEEIRQLVAEGKVAIPANKHHECLDPEGIGSMLRTKINVNLGVSRDCKDYNIEMKKVMCAVNMGAEAIMDLSSHGNTQPFRQKLTHECPVMIGTVPVYDSVIHYQRDLAELTAQDFIDVDDSIVCGAVWSIVFIPEKVGICGFDAGNDSALSGKLFCNAARAAVLHHEQLSGFVCGRHYGL